MQSNIKTKLIGATGGALVLAMAAGGVAYASTGSSVTASKAPAAASTEAATTTTAKQIGRTRLRREVRYVLRHTVHAQLIVKTKSGYKTLDVDRGVVVSDSSNVLTIKRPDGPTVSATITGSTQFYGLTPSHIAAGDRAVIVQTSGNAVLVGSKVPRTSSSSTAGS